MSAIELADLLKRQDAELAAFRAAHDGPEPRRHDVSAERYSASQACVVELSDKLIVAWRDVEVWRAVTVALAAELADHGTYVPSNRVRDRDVGLGGDRRPLWLPSRSSPAVLAYSHARNGRMAEALEVLA